MVWTCTNTRNECRHFTHYADALRFVMAEGDASRLWTLELTERAA